MKKNNFILLIALGIILTGCWLKPGTTPNNAGEQIPNGQEAVNNQPIPYQLDLSGQGLTKIPDDVFKRTELVELNIASNKLTGALPAEIRHLSNLVVLNASNNQMTGVPAEVGQLSKLEILNLANNKLTGLPYELGNLQNLKVLNISGNDYSEQDLEVIKQKLPVSVNIIK